MLIFLGKLAHTPLPYWSSPSRGWKVTSAKNSSYENKARRSVSQGQYSASIDTLALPWPSLHCYHAFSK